MRSTLQILIGLLILFSCAYRESTDMKLIEKSVQNFFDWHIENADNGINLHLINPDGVTGEESEYFDSLKLLGTVSEKFIDSAKQELKTCYDSLQKMNWKKYQTMKGNKCDFLYFYVWLYSQENVDKKIKINKVTIDNDNAIAQLTFITVINGQENDTNYNILVYLEKEDKAWLLKKIEKK